MSDGPICSADSVAEQLTCFCHTHARLIFTFDAREQPVMASPRTDSVALS
jgi:hypothetical protein